MVQDDRKAAIRSYEENSRYQSGGGPHKFRSASNMEVSKHLSVEVNTVAASVSIPLEYLKGIW